MTTTVDALSTAEETTIMRGSPATDRTDKMTTATMPDSTGTETTTAASSRGRTTEESSMVSSTHVVGATSESDTTARKKDAALGSSTVEESTAASDDGRLQWCPGREGVVRL